MKTEAETGVMWLQAEECQQPLEAGGGKRWVGGSEAQGTDDELRKDQISVLSGCHVCGNLLQQRQEMNTL